MSKYINFNDEKIPVGKRKVAYIKYLMSRYDYKLVTAQRLANKRFGYGVMFPKLLFLYCDYGRFHQNSFRGVEREIWDAYDWYIKRAGKIEYEEIPDLQCPQAETIIKEREKEGYKVIRVPFTG